MTWSDPGHPWAGLVALLLGLLIGSFGPRLVALVPEPKPVPAPEVEPEVAVGPSAPKTLYADLGARAGLAGRLSLATGIGTGAVGASVGWHWPLLFLLPVAVVCVLLGYIDLHTKLLPSVVLLPTHAVAIALAGVAAVVTGQSHPLVRALVAMAVVRSVFWLLWWIRSSGMGFGDVRLSALLSFCLGYLGWAEVAIGVYAGFLVFVVPGLTVALVRRDRAYLKTRVPFGPALVIGALLAIVFGPWISTSLGY